MRSGYPVREKGFVSLNFPRGSGSTWNFPQKLKKLVFCLYVSNGGKISYGVISKKFIQEGLYPKEIMK